MNIELSNFITWDELKSEFPEVVEFFVDLYKKSNGFIIREPGFIYLIHAVGSDFYKIGKTTNPDRRILQIAPQMPFPTRYVRVWRSDFMSIAEKMLHEQFEYVRTNGEWFELSGDELSALTNSSVEIQYAYFQKTLESVNTLLSRRSPRSILMWDRFPTSCSELLPIGSIWVEHCFLNISSELTPPLPDSVASEIARYIAEECS